MNYAHLVYTLVNSPSLSTVYCRPISICVRAGCVSVPVGAFLECPTLKDFVCVDIIFKTAMQAYGDRFGVSVMYL